MNYPKEFPEYELACHCCGECHMDRNFLNKLLFARKLANIPFNINSGYRCPKYNASDVVGSTSQNHTSGRAVDISVTGTNQRMVIMASLIKAGFRRIGVYKTFIHADNMNEGGISPEAMWME